VNTLIAQARREGRESAQATTQQQQQQQQPSPEQFAAGVAAALQSFGFALPGKTQTPAGPHVGADGRHYGADGNLIAVGSRVPGAHEGPMRDGPTGAINIWNLSNDQIEQLGPHGLRAEHEKILAHARGRSGAPPMPKQTMKKGGG
jgi:hypothetical protein